MFITVSSNLGGMIVIKRIFVIREREGSREIENL